MSGSFAYSSFWMKGHEGVKLWLVETGNNRWISLADSVREPSGWELRRMLQSEDALCRLPGVSDWLPNVCPVFDLHGSVDPFLPCDGGSAAIVLAYAPGKHVSATRAGSSPKWMRPKSRLGRERTREGTAHSLTKADKKVRIRVIALCRATAKWSTPERQCGMNNVLNGADEGQH
jgi:hypothetical protein